ncbi:MAG: hypothetical protein B7Y59_11290 [Burkholderiales bacterium 35-55-47]|jgi:hypothetical protein|uniref:hypothetical protein n=1 Tax=Limnohabitans sp. TaxID=1907725 RepID=UPI000BD1CA8C|nr:hypothetical protein [Limnohabitans sp.]OYY17884.1 MAG: hypothetical protein B7Y59_11290 [Burkholderiales bacterium 35-55-47]OYZ72180.1 MAG: hypothetical protein B7Y06_11280 [Burkholderiales bacterium 24-55-52]OZA99552.1 MAG: hypothetical protein B7X62_09765 [Burkholderiales bacterium 39-55-53]HQR86851.1 hypothetical protein [Limnohabitans sp.]HQS27052.1 hypothetical protein [Limnohabitans sp.]
MAVDPTRPSQLFQRKTQVAWINSSAQWTHAVTLTFPRNKLGIAPSEEAACNTANHLVNVLNRILLGRGNVRNGHKIGSAFVFGTGPYGDHPHIHMALAAPPSLSNEAMTQEIDNAIHQIEGLGHQLLIKPYKDAGWIDYMLDHCSDGFEVELNFPATPQKATSVLPKWSPRGG